MRLAEFGIVAAKINVPACNKANFIFKLLAAMQTAYKFILLPVVWLGSVCFAAAQILNIDKTDTAAYQKKAKWNGVASLGVEIDQEKSTLFDGSNFVDLALQKNKELFIFSGSNRFTYDGSTSFLNTGFLHIRWRHDYKKPLHVESFLQFQWDANRGMRHRSVAGGNLRYTYWHKRTWELTFASGLFYENELWDYSAVDSAKIPPGAVTQTANKIRSNNYIKWEGKPTPTTTVAAVLFYQAPFNNFISPRVSININFKVDVTKHFLFGILFSGLYDAKPVVPIFNYYYSFANTLAYKF